MAQFNTPSIKPEMNDGSLWFTLATESWVKNLINQVPPCTAATTSNLNATYYNGASGSDATLTNADAQKTLVIDGVTLSGGSLVLVKDQTTMFQNGIYTVINTGSISTNWVLRRITAYDSALQMTRGGTISVFNGTLWAASVWMLTATVTAVGTSDIIFTNIDKTSLSSVLGTTKQIIVSVVGGVATLSIAPNPVFPGTESITIPTGTMAQRPTSVTAGMLRFTTTV